MHSLQNFWQWKRSISHHACNCLGFFWKCANKVYSDVYLCLENVFAWYQIITVSINVKKTHINIDEYERFSLCFYTCRRVEIQSEMLASF